MKAIYKQKIYYSKASLELIHALNTLGAKNVTFTEQSTPGIFVLYGEFHEPEFKFIEEQAEVSRLDSIKEEVLDMFYNVYNNEELPFVLGEEDIEKIEALQEARSRD